MKILLISDDYMIDDMALSADQFSTYMGDTNDQRFSFGRKGPEYLWPNREMPVDFDNETMLEQSHGRKFVEGSMSEMNKELCGCFRFRYST